MGLLVVALFGLVAPNGLFIYWALYEFHGVGRVLENHLAVAFILDAFITLILLAVHFAKTPPGRYGWGWFVGLSLIIGVCGGLVGLGLGFTLSSIIDRIPFETAALPTIKTFPVLYSVKYYIIGIVFAMVTTYLAALFPARRAGRVDPVVIIRGK